MYPVLFVLIFVVAIVVISVAQKRKRQAKTAEREEALPALAPVISGSLGPGTGQMQASRTLSGTYDGHRVEAAFVVTGAGITTEGVSTGQNQIEALRLILRDVDGAQPWCFRLGYGHRNATRWWWIGPEYFMGPVGKRLFHMTGLTQDPDLEDRLRRGGIAEALERLGVPPKAVGLPNVRFEPDLTPLAMERRERQARAGIEPPERALKETRDIGGRLVIDVERTDNSDPSPERFREILDAAVGIAQLNARINPGEAG